MRSLKDYLTESEDYLTKPAVGDVFEIEIARDEMMISGYITECVDDGIVIELDDRGVALLEGYGYVADAKSALGKIDSRFKSLSGRSLGDAAREYGDEADRLQKEIDAQQAEIDRRADKDIPFTPDEKITDKDQFGNVIKHKARHLARKGLSQAQIQKEDLTPDQEDTQIDELSKSTLASYANKAADDAGRKKDAASGYVQQFKGHSSKSIEKSQQGDKRLDGIKKAVARLANEDLTPDQEGTQISPDLEEAEYRGRKVKLGKPMQGDVKKSKVYVRGPKGNVVKVNFGDPNMKIKKSNPKRRKSFRARHNCDNPGPRWKARYWSCRAW